MIPRLIHQTWRDASIPEAMRAYAESWRRHHPGWTYRLWTDADLAALVETRFPDLAGLFAAYPLPIMRADLGRYLVLAAHGGLYADLDAEALAPWDRVLASERPVFAEEPASHAAAEFVVRRGFRRLVSNAIIASPAGHGFWDHCLDLLKRCRHAPGPLDATGPFVITAAVDSAPARAMPDVFPAYVTSPVDKFGAATPHPPGDGAAPLAQHHWHGTWWQAGRKWLEKFPAADRERPIRAGLRGRLRERIARAKLNRSLAAAERERGGAPPAGDTILVAVPVRDAAATLDALFAALLSLDHPKSKISLAFLEGDSADDSYARLTAFARAHRSQYRRIVLQRRRFASPRYERRWEPHLQRARRAHLARVRNYLIDHGLGDEDWVLWLDADVIGFPRDLVASLLGTQTRVAQPNTVLQPGGRTFDTNGWMVERAVPESTMLTYVLNGLYQPPLGYQRLYLSDLRYRERVALDSVGGTALLVDARLHRAGIGFPETPYRYLIETEGFGAVLRDHGIEIAGLPNVEVVHFPA